MSSFDEENSFVMLRRSIEKTDAGIRAAFKPAIDQMLGIIPDGPEQVDADQESARPTQYAREKIARAPEVAADLRRNTGRISQRALAMRLEVDRNTLRDWIARGWLSWPPPPPG